MPRFEPFRALRYTGPDRPTALDDLAAPPYDVISAEQRAMLEGRHQHNSVRLDFPHDEDGVDGYSLAARRLHDWVAQGALRIDGAPSYTRYRMTAPGTDGSPFSTVGVFGALGLEPPDTGDVLPHERTTPKDKADRLSLLRATRINTSPIWGLSLAKGLGALLATDDRPQYRAVDEDGVVHEAWVLDETAVIEQIRACVESQPVVVADGHHRYETAHAFADEQRRADATAAPGGAHDAIMALIVELAEDQLAVRPIHRIVEGLPEDTGAVTSALAPWFEASPAPADLLDDPATVDRLVRTGSLCLVSGSTATLLRPKPNAFPDAIQLDSERVAIALDELARGGIATTVRFHHDIATVRAAAATQGTAGVLLRPVTVAQIESVAHARDRMPPKSTFFWPKPRTGMVFRPLDPDTFAKGNLAGE